MAKISIGSMGVGDYMKAVRKADREVELSLSTGFRSKTKVHKSKKIYNRKEGKRIKPDDLPFLFYFFCASINRLSIIT